MALQVPLANDKKRVKVYELRDNDWFDRGTGFCTGQIINVSERQSGRSDVGHSRRFATGARLRAFCLLALSHQLR
jgi:hypothetical protein